MRSRPDNGAPAGNGAPAADGEQAAPIHVQPEAELVQHGDWPLDIAQVTNVRVVGDVTEDEVATAAGNEDEVATAAGNEEEGEEEGEEEEEEEEEESRRKKMKRVIHDLCPSSGPDAQTWLKNHAKAQPKRSRTKSNSKGTEGGFVSKPPDLARSEGDSVVTGGMKRTCVMDACARALDLDSKKDTDRVRELRGMLPEDAHEDTKYEEASKVLRENEGKKIVVVTSEFNGQGGMRLNLLLAGKEVFKAERKLLVALHVKVPHAKKGDQHCVFFSGKSVYNNTYLSRSTRSGDFSSYPVTEVEEKDLTHDGARALWDSLYPSHWVSLSRVFEIVEASDPRESV